MGLTHNDYPSHPTTLSRPSIDHVARRTQTLELSAYGHVGPLGFDALLGVNADHTLLMSELRSPSSS